MPRFTSAEEAADWLQGKRYAGAKNGLANMRALTEALGHPEQQLTMIHVAGTNGKGSVCACTERMLRACGKKTGQYSSPYLTKYNDRMRVNGVAMPDETLIRLTERVTAAAEALTEKEIYPTAFELGTALAFLWFAEEHVDYAVIEVGIGGRLDPTNIITPAVCGIAAIGLDHTAMLGDTLEAIAAEKAGIIKDGVPCAASVQAEGVMQVFSEACLAHGSRFLPVEKPEILASDAYGCRFVSDGLEASVSLPGAYQAENAALALTMVRLLAEKDPSIDIQTALQALPLTRWPARLTWIGNVLVDGAHNPQGAAALVSYINAYFPDADPVLVTAMMQDKDYSECARIYAGTFRRIIATQIDYYRCATAQDMHDALLRSGVESEIVPNIPNAVERAKALAGPQGIVVTAGSLYLAGDVISYLQPDLGAAL